MRSLNYNGRLPILKPPKFGAYTPDVNVNQLGSIRVYGYILVTIIFMCSVGFGTWSMKYRSSQIVRASQPFFLVMICAGTMVLGASIIPLGIDDGDASPLSCSLEDYDACDRACMAVPWCLMLGWSIVFSALFSKLWRVK
jgi:gamma-aminobutyric acid type B receptor